MAIEEQELDLAKKAEAEKAREAELQELRQARQEAEIARAKAEGEAEALRKGVRQEVQAPSPWTDEQWEAEGQKYGMTGVALKAVNGLASGHAELIANKFKESLDLAKREAQEAKEEAKKARSERSLYDTEREFYDKNPELVGRKGDVAEFMSLLGSDVKNDPKKYADALAKAKVYAIGKAKENIAGKRSGNTVRTNTERTSLAGNEMEEEDKTEEMELDTRGLEEHEARLIRSIAENPGGKFLEDKNPPLDELPLEKAYALCENFEKTGVSIDSRSEFARGEKRMDRTLRELAEKK